MSTFVYTAFDSKGKLFRGDVEEKSWTQALRRVREMGLFPTSVKERASDKLRQKFKTITRPRVRDGAIARPLFGGKISPKVISAFTRQLATLLGAGIPLVRALRSIQDQEENARLRSLLGDVMAEIEGGSTLSEALNKHPKVFSRFYINMVVAGETAGMLDGTLARLADFTERTLRIRSKIKSALVYPAAVIFVAIGIMTLITMVVIPRFKAVFVDLTGGGLPAFTQFVLDSSDAIKGHSLHAVVFLAAIIAGFKFLNSKPHGRFIIDRIRLKLPVLGRITQKAAIARFTRTLGTMLQNGVPVLQALMIARETTTNAVYAHIIKRAHERVKDGDTIVSPLQGSGVFPSTVISMIDVGEQSGALPEMLLKVADIYDEEVDNSIAAALSLLEPALIIFLAVIVGSIVIALFLPIINAVPQGGGQGGE